MLVWWWLARVPRRIVKSKGAKDTYVGVEALETPQDRIKNPGLIP
jgi:hypothetical protein